MAYFKAITIVLAEAGCVDESAANYNPKATIDTGVCYDASFEQCVQNHLFSVSLKECSDAHIKRTLKIYALFDSYKQSVKENNQVKIDIYTKQLTELCSSEYCESC